MTNPIPGYAGYLATSDGQVIGKSGQPLRTRSHWRTGHLRVRLYHRDAPPRVVDRRGSLHLERYTDLYVHVAVALAFHGPRPFEGALVRHWDDDPTNNRPSNLCWGTRLDNADDARRNSRDDDGFDWATGESLRAAGC